MDPANVVVITGSSSGIGRELALRIAHRRVHLVLAARRQNKLAEVAEECLAQGAAAVTCVACDITDEAQCVNLRNVVGELTDGPQFLASVGVSAPTVLEHRVVVSAHQMAAHAPPTSSAASTQSAHTTSSFAPQEKMLMRNSDGSLSSAALQPVKPYRAVNPSVVSFFATQEESDKYAVKVASSARSSTSSTSSRGGWFGTRSGPSEHPAQQAQQQERAQRRMKTGAPGVPTAVSPQRRRGRLGLLVLNAGRGGIAPFDSSPSSMRIARELMDVNYFSNVRLTQLFLPFLTRDHSTLVVVSSISALLATPGRTQYCASKFAVQGFFNSLRQELRPKGVQITVVCPNLVQTEFHEKVATPSGKPPPREGKFMTPRQAAKEVLEAADRGADEHIMSWGGYVGYRIRPFFTRIIDGIAAKKANSTLADKDEKKRMESKL